MVNQVNSNAGVRHMQLLLGSYHIAFTNAQTSGTTQIMAQNSKYFQSKPSAILWNTDEGGDAAELQNERRSFISTIPCKGK